MEIQLIDIGKKFNRSWLYKDISKTFATGSNTAIIGNNGSGKSTLLQIIYAWQVPSKGKLLYGQSNTIKPEEVHQFTSFAAPYLELPEELTLLELLTFHFKFKPIQPHLNVADTIMLSGLAGSEHKQIRYFSSGMKQRAKLLLALFSQHELLLLDEPCSNLDEQGINWYKEMMQNRPNKATTIIASNQKFEYEFADSELRLADYLPKVSQ